MSEPASAQGTENGLGVAMKEKTEGVSQSEYKALQEKKTPTQGKKTRIHLGKKERFGQNGNPRWEFNDGNKERKNRRKWCVRTKKGGISHSKGLKVHLLFF